MANRSKHRHQPYDLNNPMNWTVAKLKNEIEKLGVKLTTSVSKSALLQIYNQVSGNRTVASAADLNVPEKPPLGPLNSHRTQLMGHKMVVLVT